MYSKIINNLVYPYIKFSYPREKLIYKNLRFLLKSQWWSPSELKRFQQQRLQLLLRHAYRNVPYYHRIFDELKLKPEDIKNSSDLQKLPILTKDIIRRNFSELIAKNYSEDELIPSYTGGYTGKRMKFFIDDRWFARNMATAQREWGWAGYKRGDKIAYLWSAPQDLSLYNERKQKIFNFIMRMKILNAYNLTELTLNEYVRLFRKFKPKIINAYASAIYLMALYIEKRGIGGIRPEAILTSCEMLNDYQRNVIERAFNCKVFDYYSGRDTSLHAAECPEHSGYHLSIENAVVEFIKNNEHVSPGEFGKIVVTDFYNYANPFIRYEIGDLGVPSDDVCSCKRGLPLMEKIAGRVTDMIITKKGQYIPGLFFIHIFDTEAIERYQFIQKTKDYAILKIVKGVKFSEKELNRIIEMIHEKCGDIEIEVEFVESIPLTKSGKYKFIISEIDMNI